jgi:uncharacterized ferritin-like protein (DUF455 family)
MWRAAEDTAGDLLGRLAVVPMVLEARGLDVTPGMIEVFRKAGDAQAVAALSVIYAEEVAHVAYGSKWFNFLCGRQDTDPKDMFHDLLRIYFHGALKRAFPLIFTGRWQNRPHCGHAIEPVPHRRHFADFGHLRQPSVTGVSKALRQDNSIC